MIARVHTKPQPIPFHSQPLLDGAQAEQRAAVPLATVSWARPALGTHKISTATTVRRAAMTATLANPLNKPPLADAPRALPAAASTPSNPTPRRSTELTAKYLGGGNLSVRSSVTGRHYRFEGHGATLPIDSRDQLMLRRIAELLIS